jgi:hypothetical protein
MGLLAPLSMTVKVDFISSNGNFYEAFNVRRPVGFGQPNLMMDVMLVQTALSYLFLTDYDFFSPRTEKIKVSGIFDSITHFAVGDYQKTMGRELWANRFDGIIHPADYKGRNLNNLFSPSAKLMMITHLWTMVRGIVMERGQGNNPNEALKRHNPQLIFEEPTE